MTTTTHTVAAAHIVTSDAVALGDPEIAIMTVDEGMGAELIERRALGADAKVADALTLARLVMEWAPVGDATEVQPGYWIVDVERI